MRISKTRDVKTPTRGTPGSAGLDFYVPNDWPGTEYLVPGMSVKIASGIHAEIPEGYMLVVDDRSSMAVQGLKVGARIIDQDYQGELHLHVVNIGDGIVEISPGDAIVQMILVPVKIEGLEVVEDIRDIYKEKTVRGEKGFGSTNTDLENE